MSFLKTSTMTLKRRLALHLRFNVALQAEGFSSEAGVLQKVGKRFIRVSGQYFAPNALQQITLLIPVKVSGASVLVRTTYAGSLRAKLVRTGTDFVELVVSTQGSGQSLILIPLNRIVSIEKL